MKYLLLLLVLTGCAVTPTEDIPAKVVVWAEKNVYQVETSSGTGSGFWLGDKFITACHVVQGGGEIHIKNLRDTQLILMKRDSCNDANDISILTPVFPDDVPETLPATLGQVPRGKAVYGAGHPLGGVLIITSGHWQGQEVTAPEKYYPEGMYIATAPTIFGDSGSPAIAVVDGQIVVVGIRVAVRSGMAGSIRIPILHLVALSGPKSLQRELL